MLSKSAKSLPVVWDPEKKMIALAKSPVLSGYYRIFFYHLTLKVQCPLYVLNFKVTCAFWVLQKKVVSIFLL